MKYIKEPAVRDILNQYRWYIDNYPKPGTLALYILQKHGYKHNTRKSFNKLATIIKKWSSDYSGIISSKEL